MRARLVTIPISHYCEEARWALDRAGIAYRDERHAQIRHARGDGRGHQRLPRPPAGAFACRLFPEER